MSVYCLACGGLIAGYPARTYNYPCRCGERIPTPPPIAPDLLRRLEVLEREIAHYRPLVPPPPREDKR